MNEMSEANEMKAFGATPIWRRGGMKPEIKQEADRRRLA